MKYICLLSLVFFSIVGNSQSEREGYYENLELASKNAEKVIHLNLYDQKISVFPEQIFKMYNLKILDLSHNNLTYIPGRIKELKNLQELYINHNKIEDLPASLAEMNTIWKLYIQANPLNEKNDIQKKIPKSVTKLESGNPPKDFIQPPTQLKQIE
jgi:Leucine-rich repeat (LRR) protein